MSRIDSEMNEARVEMLNTQFELAKYYLELADDTAEKRVWTVEVSRITKALAKARAA